MAQQLHDRLAAVLDTTLWTNEILADQAHWPAGVGRRIADVRTMVVHETSGWPYRARGRDMFRIAFLPGVDHPHRGETTQFYVSGDGTVIQGMEPPKVTFHANFINFWALGSETGHGWGNYHEDHIGPYTSSDETLVADPDHPGHLKKGPHYGEAAAPLRIRPASHWLPLSGNDAMAAAGDDDVPGLKFWVQPEEGPEILVTLWTTPRYNGPWREPQRVPEMQFSERQYRTWALLGRFLAEEFLLPRNFPLLPHKTRSGGHALGNAAHGMLNDAASFASIVLADEGLSRSPATFLAAGVAISGDALRAAYPGGRNADGSVNRHWTHVFNIYRGFHGHGFSGDPDGGNDHDCPGPTFDWHRFAREVWDWWWHPFDLDTAHPDQPVDRRPYSLATRDGSTPLKEYYWPTPVATMTARSTQGIHGARSTPRTFALPQGARVYALANGEVVAARFGPDNAGVDMSMLVVRHEVFHQLDPRPAAPAPQDGLPQFAGRIDYDVAPSSVFSLYMHLGRPVGLNFQQVDEANPDWLNRLLTRMKECDLGHAFRASQPGQAIHDDVWNADPPGLQLRTSLSWDLDRDNYRPTIQRLAGQQLTLMASRLMVTPIRILLGDYLGDAGVIRRDAAGPHFGVRIEVFSRDVISREFTASTTDVDRGFVPAVGTAPFAVSYPSEWSQVPAGALLAALKAAGVTDMGAVNWWDSVQLATTARQGWPDDARLIGDGWAVHYDPYEFLPWLNARTWASEWPKYRAANAANPGQVPASPIPRP